MLSLSTALPLFTSGNFHCLGLVIMHPSSPNVIHYILHKLNTALLSVQFSMLGAMLLPFSYIFLGGWTYLVLLIVITLNRAIMISLSWYHNHFKYLQIQKMITVINTSDKRIKNEIFQKPPTTTMCLSQF